MTPSLGLVFAIALLAPGIAAYLALIRRPGAARIHPAQPQPGSLLAIAVVGLGALAAHALGTGLFALNRLVVEAGYAPLRTVHPTDPYAIALQARGAAAGFSTVELFTFLAWTMLLAAIAYAIATRAARTALVRRLLFGWMARLVDDLDRPPEPGYERVLAAFVITPLAEAGVQLGYRGYVEAVALDAEREITSLVLRDARRFTLKLHPGGLSTAQHFGTEGGNIIPRLYLPRGQICNAVLTMVDLPALPPSPSPSPPRG